MVLPKKSEPGPLSRTHKGPHRHPDTSISPCAKRREKNKKNINSLLILSRGPKVFVGHTAILINVGPLIFRQGFFTVSSI